MKRFFFSWGSGFKAENDTADFGEFHRITEEIDQDLTEFAFV